MLCQNKSIYRFESCPDYNELITQMDSFIPKDDDILLGVRQERSLKFSLVDITTELGRQIIS
jgi:hypothetical protein